MILKGDEKILFLGASGLGDLISYLGIFDSIKAKYPNIKIEIFSNSKTAEEIKSMNGNIDKVWFSTLANFTFASYLRYLFLGLLRETKNLKKQKYDLVIVVRQNYARILICFFLWLSGVKIIYHSIRHPHNIPLEYGVLEKLGISFFKEKVFLNSPEKNKIKSKKTIVINMFCADSPQSSRDWDKWGDTIEALSQDFNIILVGKADFDYKVYYQLNYEHVTDLINKTEKLNDLVSVLINADLVLSVDSFIFHLSYALGNKTLGLFGPVDATTRIPPTIDKTRVSFLSKKTDCSPCILKHHKAKCRYDTNYCMQGIPVHDVVEKLKLLVQEDDSNGKQT